MAWLFILGSFLTACSLWSILSVVQNWNIARKVGLPLVLTPINPFNPLVLGWGRYFIRHLPPLPEPFRTWIKLTEFGWAFDDKTEMHDRLGPAFIHVHPGGNALYVADPDAVLDILTRRKDFRQPEFAKIALEVFGPNLNTVHDADWQRHRRLTAACFNERTSSDVWEESQAQAKELVDGWASFGTKGTNGAAEDMMTVTFNLLTYIGFGIRNSFGQEREAPRKGYSMPLSEILQTVLLNLTLIAIFPSRYLKSQVMPASFRRVGKSVDEFRTYIHSMVQSAKNDKSTSGTSNLLSVLVKASENAKSETRSLGLSDDEVQGNMFMFNIAGQDTTANSILFAFALLAAYPEWQDWLFEELDAVLGDKETLDYSDICPKLERCMAILFETLRTYGPIPIINKVAPNDQDLSIGSKSYHIPARTGVYVNTTAIHVNEKIWGSDALTWRPSRWVTVDPKTGASSLFQPRKADFIPWSTGPRICPGMRLAQVEFVGVLATVFRHHKVRPVLKTGESEAVGLKRLERVINDSAVRGVSLKMLHAEDVHFIWEKR